MLKMDFHSVSLQKFQTNKNLSLSFTQIKINKQTVHIEYALTSGTSTNTFRKKMSLFLYKQKRNIYGYQPIPIMDLNKFYNRFVIVRGTTSCPVLSELYLVCLQNAIKKKEQCEPHLNSLESCFKKEFEVL